MNKSMKAILISQNRIPNIDKNMVKILGYLLHAKTFFGIFPRASESVSFANFRKNAETEYDAVYIVNLKGNHRTSGERCRQEGENVFGVECRTGIAILFLVRK